MRRSLQLRLEKMQISHFALGRIGQSGERGEGGPEVRPGSATVAATLKGGSTGGWRMTTGAKPTEETCPCDART